MNIRLPSAALAGAYFTFIAATLLAGCASAPMAAYEPEEQEPIPVSPWGGRYSFSYEPPGAATAGAVDATISVVNAFYKEDESALMEPSYSKVGKGFSASMGADMDKILIAKGMTAKGPFATRDEITYSDKKDSSLTLVPRVFVNAQIKYAEPQNDYAPPRAAGGLAAGLGRGMAASSYYGQDQTVRKSFEMTVGGWVSFAMQEPLSEEKMWIKKLELEDVVVSGEEVSQSGQTVYDGKPDAMANALKQLYPTIMDKFWKYIDTQEILALKAKTAEIRKLKRY